VRGRYNCVRDIGKTTLNHFVLTCLLSWSEYVLAPFRSKEIALSRFSLPLVCLFLALEGL
jgi:hypothetical protein